VIPEDIKKSHNYLCVSLRIFAFDVRYIGQMPRIPICLGIIEFRNASV
jgi:hypothetical protein